MTPARDQIQDLLDERGPMSVAEILAAVDGFTRTNIKAAIDRCVSRGEIHSFGSRGRLPGFYKLGPAPGWMPSPMPANSVWQYASR